MSEKKKGGWWWPDVNDEMGMKSAINSGAIVGLWIAISYVFSVAMMLFTGKGIFTGELSADERVSTMIVEVIIIVLALIFGWRVWKKAGHISAIIIFIWCIVEVALKAYVAPGKGLVISIILLVAATNGVRGTLAKKKQLKSPAPA